MTSYLTGRYVDKEGALEVLAEMNIHWTRRQIDCTAEPDSEGQRKWPWFLDAKGVLRIDEGFIRAQFRESQLQALQKWKQNEYKL